MRISGRCDAVPGAEKLLARPPLQRIAGYPSSGNSGKKRSNSFHERVLFMKQPHLALLAATLLAGAAMPAFAATPSPSPSPHRSPSPSPTASAHPHAKPIHGGGTLNNPNGRPPIGRPTSRPVNRGRHLGHRTPSPTPTASAHPTSTPSATPSAKPSATPSPKPSVTPSSKPSTTPSPKPTRKPD